MKGVAKMPWPVRLAAGWFSLLALAGCVAAVFCFVAVLRNDELSLGECFQGLVGGLALVALCVGLVLGTCRGPREWVAVPYLLMGAGAFFMPLFAGTLWGAGNPTKAPVKPVDLVYSTDLPQKDGGPLKLSLACPKSDKPLPCFVFIHGGAWSHGSRTHCPFRRELTAAGWAYASIDYRLNRKGSYPLPEQLEDCRAAIWFLRKNATEYGLDPKRICVGGGSAGGHLAALVAVTAAPDSGIVAAVDMFGPTDFHSIGVAMLAAERQNPGKNPKMKAISQAVGLTDPEALLAHFDELAPVERLKKLAPGSKLPRFLVLHSKGDPVVPVGQSEVFASALREFGADVTLKVYEGTKHAVPPSAAGEILKFLK